VVDVDPEQVIELSHTASLEIINGNAQPFVELYSQREDVTLANPFGGIARGPENVRQTLERAASYYRDGEIVSIDNFETWLAVDILGTVEVERLRARVAGRENLDEVALRVTSIFRHEEDEWRLVHRHADTRVGPQAPESVVESDSPVQA
jgi:ketosteroid isomerase-like protein